MTVSLPSDVGVPLVQYRRPLSVCLVAVLNGGVWCVVAMPRLRVGFGVLCRTTSPCVVLLPLVLSVVGGEVRWCAVVAVVEPCLALFYSSPLSLCLLSQHCWFRCASLWQGCVIAE